jgi:DNA-binding transcriptional ArsR family regulator
MAMDRVGTATVHDVDEAAALEPAATLYRALGEPVRLTILQHLATGEHRVRDLTDHLNLAQSTVSAHLACLRDCGLVDSRPAGRATVYSLRDPDRLTALLAATETFLAATGSTVALRRHMAGHHDGESR